MISKKNYTAIVLMMIVILFMFQFSQIIRDTGNEYGTNEYWRSGLLSGENAWNGGEIFTSPDDIPVGSSYVIYYGSTEKPVFDMITQWCTYTKHSLVIDNIPGETKGPENCRPDMIMIDGALLEDLDDKGLTDFYDGLAKIKDDGTPVIFCSLPGTDFIKGDETFKEISGITEVAADEVHCTGIRLMDNFLIGGEEVYKVPEGATEEEMEYQDLDLDMPWFYTGKGTTSYMTGMVDDDDLEFEKYPKIIWKNNYDGQQIFFVNGDYMDSLTGIGFLDAIWYEASDYVIYPVINGINYSIVDFPMLADENNESMQSVYSRGVLDFERDIAWPGLLSLAKKNNITYTCFIEPKYNYKESTPADGDALIFYLRQLKEISAEAGRSFRYRGLLTVTGKLAQDDMFYRSMNVGYTFSACFTDKPTDDFKDMLDLGISGVNTVDNIHCIVTPDYGESPLISYYSDNITMLGITGSAARYSYSKDLELKSIATALGYSNTMIDLHKVYHPLTTEDEWQIFFEKIAGNVSTYYTGENGFAQTTISDSDYKARIMMNLDYSDYRDGSSIVLKVDQPGDESYFLLRTHGDEIISVNGGDYKYIEDGTYLIHATGSLVKIETKIDPDRYVYEIPF